MIMIEFEIRSTTIFLFFTALLFMPFCIAQQPAILALQSLNKKHETEVQVQKSHKKLPESLCSAIKEHYQDEEETISIIKTYLQTGYIQATNTHDDNLLHLVCRYRNGPKVVNFLLSGGLDIEARNAEENTPLILAMQGSMKYTNNQKETIETLIQKGAYIDQEKMKRTFEQSWKEMKFASLWKARQYKAIEKILKKQLIQQTAAELKALLNAQAQKKA